MYIQYCDAWSGLLVAIVAQSLNILVSLSYHIRARIPQMTESWIDDCSSLCPRHLKLRFYQIPHISCKTEIQSNDSILEGDDFWKKM